MISAGNVLSASLYATKSTLVPSNEMFAVSCQEIIADADHSSNAFYVQFIQYLQQSDIV